MIRRASFRIDGHVVHIVNSHPRQNAVILIACAVFLMVLPFVRRYLPEGLIDYPEEGQSPWGLFLLGIVLCLSAAFWWSVVTLDPAADQVLVLRRWGLFCSKRRWALSSFDAITLRKDTDGEVSVYLEGSGRNWSIETNNNKAIVWGRPYEEARALAEKLAQHLHLRLDDQAQPWCKIA